MLIIGAGGFARELLQVLVDLKLQDTIYFYDDVNADAPDLLYGKFQVLKQAAQAKSLFEQGHRDYILGIGNPAIRKKMKKKFDELGGNLCSAISPSTIIGSYDVHIGEGCNMLSTVTISNSAKIGNCCLMYYGTIITHDCVVGDYVELSPNVVLLGRCVVGDLTHIGANSTVLPKVKIGKNVVIGAGSLVTRDIPDNSLAYGVPARIAKKLH